MQVSSIELLNKIGHFSVIHAFKEINAVWIIIKWTNILKVMGTEFSYFTCEILFPKLYNG